MSAAFFRRVDDKIAQISSNRNAVLAVVGCLSVFLGYKAMSAFTSASLDLTARNRFHEKAFVLMMAVTFEDVQKKEAFKEVFKPMAEYVMKYEPRLLIILLIINI